MKTKLDIISGFLGAGKTTFIKKLIDEVYHQENLIILENEFGKINLDGENFIRDGIQVESICAGCICCTGAGALSKSIISIVERYHPDRIVIEPTGIAKLSDIRRLLREPDITGLCTVDHVVTIVDAKNYHNRMLLSKVFFENQIQWSEVIFLSKTQTMEQAEINDIVSVIRQIQPECDVIEDDWDSIPSDKLKEYISRKRHRLSGQSQIYAVPHTRGSFESFSYESEAPMDAEKISNFIKIASTAEFGKIERIKGIFQDNAGQWFAFEYVPRDIRFCPIEDNISDESKKFKICVIGIELRKAELKETLLY